MRGIGRGDPRHRIDDGLVVFRRNPRQHAHFRFGLGVGGVDDAQRRLAAGDVGQGGAHVVGFGEAVLHFAPQAQGLQRLPGIAPGRNAGGLREGEAAVRAQRGPKFAGAQRHRRRRRRRRHQHQAVARQQAPRRGIDQAAFLQMVHPCQIGGDEHVGRGTLFDLPRQGGTAGVGHHHRLPGSSGPEFRRGIQAFLQAGGREHRQPLRHRGARRQGAQLALLEGRLRYAAAQGCTIGMMVAQPRSGSQRNAERHGFRIAYTRYKWHLQGIQKQDAGL